MQENTTAPKHSVRHSQVEMTELVLPNDTNQLGNLLGGRLMHLMDIAMAIAAARHSGLVCVTASVDEINFLHPIRLGQVVILRASVNRVFRTSMSDSTPRAGRHRHHRFFTRPRKNDAASTRRSNAATIVSVVRTNGAWKPWEHSAGILSHATSTDPSQRVFRARLVKSRLSMIDPVIATLSSWEPRC
jgi:acyl-coenzyme A thioesterase PaaI-like protein